MKKSLILAAVLLVGAGRLWGEELSDSLQANRVAEAELAVTKSLLGAPDGAALPALHDALKDPLALRAVTLRALEEVEDAKVNGKSAIQVSQKTGEGSFRLGLIQVYQNQRIIELLQQIANAKKAPG